MPNPNGVVVEPERLSRFCQQVFTAAGIPEDEASIVARCLVDANLVGLHSHGVSRVSDYLSRLETGLVQKATRLEVVAETPGTVLLDAGNGWGQVASQAAVDIAVRKAREVGTAWVGVRNSNHNGTAGYWTGKLAAAGMAGIAGTNGSPVMAPFGGREASLGTNPISIAVPSATGRPIVLDMATSAQARGRILLARKNGEPIPQGWALTRDGLPTTDAQEAWDGILLPAAGPKGSGLAMMVDILSGVLNGASFGATMPRMYADPEPQRLGHFFIALDIAALTPMGEFLQRMATRERETREMAPAPGVDAVLMPGDVEAANAERHLRDGISLSNAIHEELVATGARLGVADTLLASATS
ncbi:Ldh family oxidoreductase [Pseudonocardia sichuanensis]